MLEKIGVDQNISQTGGRTRSRETQVHFVVLSVAKGIDLKGADVSVDLEKPVVTGEGLAF